MIKPISYLQTDSRWKDISYAVEGEKATIGTSGCGPSCMAMVIATLRNKSITPKETCAWSLSNGYKAKNQGTYYSYFAPQGKAFNIDVYQLNGTNLYGSTSQVSANYHTRALDEISKGNMVICCMGKGNWTSNGHYILWYGMDGTNSLINDPNSTAQTKTRAAIALLQEQVKYYFIVDVKNSKPHSENYYTVQKTYGFDDITMQYLEAYRYSDSLLALMLQDKNSQKYQLNTINYLLEYKYGKELFIKLFR